MTTQRLMRATAALALLFAAHCGGEDTPLGTTAPQTSDGTGGTSGATQTPATEKPTPSNKPGAGKPTTPDEPNTTKPGEPGTTKPGEPGTGCTIPPAPSMCVETRSDKGESCTTCYDAKGTVVKKGCSTSGGGPVDCGHGDGKEAGKDGSVPANGGVGTGGVPPKGGVPSTGGAPANGCATPPPPVVCTETRNEKGDVCTVCFDEKKTVLKQGCSVSPPTGTPGTCPAPSTKEGAVPGKPGDPNTGCTPPSSPIKCAETRSDKGETCIVCYDEKGSVVKQGCSAATQPPATGCHEETAKDGTSCKVCLDASGKEVARGCSGPAPAVRCEAVMGNGVVCKVCYDASGAPVMKDCAP